MRINPGKVTLATNQLIRFRAGSFTSAGDSVGAAVTWTTTGGTILPDGLFSAGTIGTFDVIGIDRSREGIQVDTAKVTVVRRQRLLKSVEITPGSISLTPGGSQTFTAIGRNLADHAVRIGVTWTATGGNIDGGGTYTAGDTGGTYQVIAVNVGGTVADTATVTISAPPPPVPPAPAPVLGQVTLVPSTATLAPSTTRQFKAYGRTTAGDSVAVSVAFVANGGTVTPQGLYTAGPSAGTFRVIASDGVLADTSVVTVTAPLGSGPARGIPLAATSLWTSFSAPSYGPAPFTASANADGPDGIVIRINAARALNHRLVLTMTGGDHARYLTDGKFSMVKWKARQDLFNTPAIKAAVAAGVADGTILGANVMDEPFHSSWGGVMTKPMVDEMAAHVKNMFPTLLAGVSAIWSWRPSERYKVVDFITTQYVASFGSVTTWRDNALVAGAQNGVAVLFAINILNGGAGFGETSCPVPPTGGIGLDSGRCAMSPAQVKQYGLTLGSAGCALVLWRYDAAYMAKSENLAAFRVLADSLAKMPAKSCRRS